jgi:hypothetical protein
MQNSRLLTIEGRLKVKILSGVIMLLLVGLHPVRVLADADNSSTNSSATAAAAAPAVTTTTDPTTTDGSDTAAAAPTPADTSTTSDTSSSSTPVASVTPTDNTDVATTPVVSTNNSANSNNAVASPTQGSDTAAAVDGNNTTVTNQTTSAAQSGNASVSQSSTASNATSGSAQTIATALNILSSSTDVQNNNLNTSVTDISGNNNNQNVVIDPTTTEGSADSQDNGETEVNTANSGTINNNLTLGAASGDATVSDNRVGGSATTGNASVDANLINITNSDLSSGQYYIGVVNIYGDLTGNILLSPDFVSQLLAENPTLLSGDTNAANTVTQTVNNTINASATSGNAIVGNNWDGGNASSGNASTSVDALNLANDDITGNNALLVFINVLGTWEGVIIGAPSGATTAEYGDATSNDAVASAATSPDSEGQATLASDTNEEINNTINATATTGNAAVDQNGIGGNAQSGNAEVSVNLLNILNSDVSLSGWFGVLFINVFGNWSGDFGIVTPPTTAVSTTIQNVTIYTPKHASTLGQSIANDAYTFFDQSSIPTVTPGQVLGTTTSARTSNPIMNNEAGSRIVASTTHARTWWLPAAAGMILSASSLGLERILRQRKQNS